MSEHAHAALQAVLVSGRLVTGPQVAAFESALATWFGVPDTVCLSDSSSALTLALYMAGVRPEGEVITSPIACSATVMPIANLFAKPVWCDVDPASGLPSVASVAAAITPRTQAVLLYSWAGDVPDLHGIAALCKQRNIKLIHDASAAFGARCQGRKVGTEADFTVYSFYATKHINTGDGAALLAADPAALQSARKLRRFGIDNRNFRLPNGDLNPEFDLPLPGFNFAMNEIAATLGLTQLAHADAITQKHQDNGAYYDAQLQGITGLQLSPRQSNTRSGHWTYSLCAERRDDLIHKLIACGIGSQRLHLRHDRFSCFASSKAIDLPGVSQFDARNLSIPCGWWLQESERDRIVQLLREGW